MPSDVAPPVEGVVTPGADARPGDAARAADATRGDHSSDSLVQEIAAPQTRARNSGLRDTGQQATGQQATGPRDDAAPDNGGQPGSVVELAVGDEPGPGNPVAAESTHTGPRHSAPRRPIPRHAAPNATKTTGSTATGTTPSPGAAPRSAVASVEGVESRTAEEPAGAVVLHFPPVEREAVERETAERETAERETAERETAERETAERETAERETAERETAERGAAVERGAAAEESASSTGFLLPGTGRRMRARLARFNAPWQSAPVAEVLEPLIATHRASHPKADIKLLQRAHEAAAHWHSGQFRKSGDPYITHPLAVATILANLGMDTTTLVAALLHDTIEDTDYTLDQMRTEFGGEVALLVDGVTKLDRVKLGDAAKAETIRKMVVAMAKDPRVLVIKLADRLHNMRTLAFLPQPKREQKARETLEILAPLAHRLGMNTIKWELEDLAFGALYPKRHEEINRLVAEHAPQRDALLSLVTQRVGVDLKSAKLKAEVTGRPKHLYSIYQKMIARSRDFGEIYDLVGVRILVDTVRDCYAALGVIHANWQPVPGRFKDYIAMPKFNMYQSLHTTVIGPNGKPVEMQIRTYAMHRTAEYGIAAHWRYKETKNATIVGPPAHIDEMTWLRQLLDWQREAADPAEFLDALRFDLSVQEVYVFTPKGDVIALPKDSTPVDFAYAVHTEVGHKCIGAKVNGKLVPLESKLSNGDVIEIFTSKSEQASPSQDWLGFVQSPRARTKIRQFFNKERREFAIEQGKDAIVKAMRKQGLPLQRMLTSESLMTIARELHLVDVTALYAAVGENQVSAQSVVTKLVSSLGGVEGATEDLAETEMPTRRPRGRPASTAHDPGVVVRGASDIWIKLARCCTPVPGDSIFGFTTRAGSVSVHRADCTNADELRQQADRVVAVEWKPTAASMFLVAIQVEALDRHKLLADITRVLSDERVNILSASVTTTRDRVAVSRFSFEMADPKHLGHLLAAVRKVDGVYDAYRVTSGA